MTKRRKFLVSNLPLDLREAMEAERADHVGMMTLSAIVVAALRDRYAPYFRKRLQTQEAEQVRAEARERLGYLDGPATVTRGEP